VSEVWLKREDLIQPETPSNKWRKLSYNLDTCYDRDYLRLAGPGRTDQDVDVQAGGQDPVSSASMAWTWSRRGGTSPMATSQSMFRSTSK